MQERLQLPFGRLPNPLRLEIDRDGPSRIQGQIFRLLESLRNLPDCGAPPAADRFFLAQVMEFTTFASASRVPVTPHPEVVEFSWGCWKWGQVKTHKNGVIDSLALAKFPSRHSVWTA